jgi:bacterioferritin
MPLSTPRWNRYTRAKTSHATVIASQSDQYHFKGKTMKSDDTTLKMLNTCLKDQLTAINQLFLHARMAGNWGLDGFNKKEYGYSIHAMKMADKLIERVLFLEGLPNLQALGKLLIGENVAEMLTCDLEMFTEMRTTLVKTVKHCEDSQDYISRDLLEDLLEHAEESIDWLESQQWLLENTGLENYLQSQMGE